MRRGANWTTDDLCDLSRAWITASCDPVVDIDQSAERFSATLHSAFVARAGNDDEKKQRYEGRSAKLVKLRFECAAYVQKFQKSLLLITSSNPTGITDKELISMAIAVHVGKIHKMSYDCLLYTSPSPRDQRGSRMPSSA